MSAPVVAAMEPLRQFPTLHCSEINLGNPGRNIQYTCVDASSDLLACGANTGSVYLFERLSKGLNAGPRRQQRTVSTMFGTFNLLKMISPPSNDRVPMSTIRISPNQKYIAVGTSSGYVHAFSLQDKRRIGEKAEFSHEYHLGSAVSCLEWQKNESRLFSACRSGMVAMTTIKSGVSSIFGLTDTELLLKEDSGIIQLDFATSNGTECVLVSSQTRVLLLQLNSDAGAAVQLGKKLRQGSYGACFFSSSCAVDPAPQLPLKVFSTRPGKRVWVGDPATGGVVSTLKFKISDPPRTFYSSTTDIEPRSLNFSIIHAFKYQLNGELADSESPQLIAVGGNAIFFLDPVSVEVSEWHVDLGDIYDLKIVSETCIVVLHGHSRKVSMIQACSSREFMQLLSSKSTLEKIKAVVKYGIADLQLLKSLRKWWKDTQETRVTDLTDADRAALVQLNVAIDALSSHSTVASPTLPCKRGDFVRFSPPLQPVAGGPIPSLFLDSNLLKRAAAQPDLKQTGNGTPMESPMGSPPVSMDALSKASLEKRFVEGTYMYQAAIQSRTEHYINEGYSLRTHGDKQVDGGHIATSALATVPSSKRRVRKKAVRIGDLRSTDVVIERHDEVRNFRTVHRMQKQLEQNMADMAGVGPLGRRPSTAQLTKQIDRLSTLLPGTAFFPGTGVIPSASEETNTSQKSSSRKSPRGRKPRLHGAGVVTPPRRKRAANRAPLVQIAMSVDGRDMDVVVDAISQNIWQRKLRFMSGTSVADCLGLQIDEEHCESNEKVGIACGKSNEGTLVRSHERPVEGISSAESTPKATLRASTTQVKVVRRRSSLNWASARPHVTIKNVLSLESVSKGNKELAMQGDDVPIMTTSSLTSTTSPSSSSSSSTGMKDTSNRSVVDEDEEERGLDFHKTRSFGELTSELNAASLAVRKEPSLKMKLWPSARITHVAYCLCHAYLTNGDLVRVRDVIHAWLCCFDPQSGEEQEENGTTMAAQGWARSGALVGGTGLPLRRKDWKLVRLLVTLYFQVCSAPENVSISLINAQQRTGNVEMNNTDADLSGLDCVRLSVVNWGQRGVSRPSEPWTESHIQLFVKKYQLYILSDAIAEICCIRNMPVMLNSVLHDVLRNETVAHKCNEIMDCIAENDIERAFEVLLSTADGSLCILLHMLDLFLKKYEKETVRLCVQSFPSIRAWIMERSLFGSQFITKHELVHSAHIESSKKLLHYLRDLLALHPPARTDPDTVHRCMEVGLYLALRGDTVLREDHTWLLEICRRPDKYTYVEPVVWNLFHELGFIEGMMELIFLKGDEMRTSFSPTNPDQDPTEWLLRSLRDLVKVIILSGDATGLWHEPGRLINSILRRFRHSSAFTDVLDCVFAVVHSDGREHRQSILSGIVLVLIQMYGLAKAVRIMEGSDSYHTVVQYISTSLCSEMLHIQCLEARQDLELKKMLNELDSYLWTVKHSQVPPQVPFHRAWTATRSTESDTHTSVSAVLQSTETLSSVTAHDEEWNQPCKGNFRRFLEDPMGGYATRQSLHDQVCGYCGLEIVIAGPLESSSLEIEVFPCGHAYHEVCLVERSCAQCLVENMRPLAEETEHAFY